MYAKKSATNDESPVIIVLGLKIWKLKTKSEIKGYSKKTNKRRRGIDFRFTIMQPTECAA